MRFRLLAFAAVLCAMLIHGCAPPPGVYAPLTRDELADLAGSLARPLTSAGAIRATGTGQTTVSGRTVRFGFALLLSGSSWLRIDFRPELMGFGTGLNALILVEDACARAYFPARVTEVRGCFDEIFGFPALEGAASLVAGFPDSALLASLEGAAVSRVDGTMTLRGALDGTPVVLTIEPELGVVTRIVAGDPDAFDEVTIEYTGHGWKDDMPCPQAVSVVAREGTTQEARVRLEYGSFREAQAIDREQYELPVLPGARVLSWSDLFGGRD